MSEAYKAAGVDLELGDDLSKMLYEAAKLTWPNREGLFGEVQEMHGSFSGLRTYGAGPILDAPRPRELEFDLDSDGIGTKVVISQRTSLYHTAAFDLIAMVCDDPAARGMEPAVMNTVFEVNRLREHMEPSLRAIAAGAVQAAAQANVAIKGGEAAELGDLIGGYGDPEDVMQYNWSGTVQAIGHHDRLISGHNIRPGDSLVGLAEDGFRSNGISLVRAALEQKYGPEWHEQMFKYLGKLGELVLKPAVVYSGALVDMTGGYNLDRPQMATLQGAAHITGGGIPGKVRRMLEPTGYGAEIEAPLEPSPLMKEVQSISGASDEEIYSVLNMGQGMILSTHQPDRAIRVLEEHGIPAREIGTVTKEPGIMIRSQGIQKTGKKLVYTS